MFSHPKILFLVPLLFVALVNSIPIYVPYEFLIFYTNAYNHVYSLGEVLIQVWLKSIKKSVSYLTNKWIHKKGKLLGFMQAPAAHEKCAMKMKKETRLAHKMVLPVYGQYTKN